MNNRIDELAWQAGCHKTMQHDPVRPEGNGWIIDQETLDKFAELLIAEVIGDCRDMFVVKSPSWKLLNEKLGSVVSED